MTDWQPIDTAPMDTSVLLYISDGMIRVGEGWAIYDYPDEEPTDVYWDVYGTGRFHPTHWMPLPNPPEGETK